MAVAAGTREGTRTGSFVLLGDERLARLAAAGHERAFTVVYQRYHQPLYRYCRSILRDDADAQDALQSTFAAAFVALARGQRDAPIRPWLFRIAHNESVSALRRRRPAAELSAASGAWTASTEDQVAERAELRMLLHDLHTLTERQRSALVMRELSGLSHEDIAIALGTSVGTAKQTIYEARRSMFEFAEGREMPCDEIRRTISDTDGRALRGRRVRAHLRDCSACAEFAAAIPARRAELRALAPALPTAAAAGLLQHVVGAGSGHAAGSGVAGLATAAAGKTASASLTVECPGRVRGRGQRDRRGDDGSRLAHSRHRSWPPLAHSRSRGGARGADARLAVAGCACDARDGTERARRACGSDGSLVGIRHSPWRLEVGRRRRTDAEPCDGARRRIDLDDDAGTEPPDRHGLGRPNQRCPRKLRHRPGTFRHQPRQLSQRPRTLHHHQPRQLSQRPRTLRHHAPATQPTPPELHHHQPRQLSQRPRTPAPPRQQCRSPQRCRPRRRRRSARRPRRPDRPRRRQTGTRSSA